MVTVTQLAAEPPSRDPASGLAAVASLRRLFEPLEDLHVTEARLQGWSWREIADALGATPRTVQRRHRRWARR